MDLRKIVSKVDRTTTTLCGEMRRRRKDVSTLGEQEALRKMRRRAIEHCIAEKEDIYGQNLGIYNFISSVFENREDIRREYFHYKEIKQKVLRMHGIPVRKYRS